MSTPVPAWPVIEVVVHSPTRGSIRGRTIQATPGQDVLEQLLASACDIARSYGRPLRVRVQAATGTTELTADPRGTATLMSTTPLADPTRTDPTRTDPTRTDPAPADPLDVEASAAHEATQQDEPATPRTAPAIRPPLPAGVHRAPRTDTGDRDQSDRGTRGRAAVSAPGQRIHTRASTRPRRFGANLVIGAGASVALAAVVLLVRPGDQGPPPHPAPAQPSAVATAGAGVTPSSAEAPPAPVVSPAALTAAAPGYSTRPAWGYAVAGGTLTGVGPDGLVTTRTRDGRVIGIAAGRGQVQWWTRQTWSEDWSGPYLTRIDDQTAVALTRRDQLTYWPVPTTTGPLQDAPVTVALPVGAQVTWGGPSPLVVLGQTAAVVHAGTLQLVALPAGARPLVADGGDILAVQGPTWLRARAGSAPQTHTIAAPAGVTAVPARVEAVGATYLLAAWPPVNRVQTVALVEVVSGRTLVITRLPAGVDIARGRTIREVGGSLTGVGALAVDTDQKKLKALLAQYEIVALTPAHIYARDIKGQRTVDIGTTGGRFDIVPVPAGADVPLAAVTPDGGRPLALTMTSTQTGWLLQALPTAS